MNYKLYQHYSLYGFANSYVVGNDASGQALLVDPGDFTVSMLNHIELNGYQLSAVLLTHSHAHHVRGLRSLLRVYDVTLFAATARVLGFPCRTVKDTERFEAAGFTVEALSVPGHSPDSMVFLLEGLLFTGDVIHAGLIGKTLSTFSARLLAERIKTKIFDLGDETIILPGHGPPSTLGSEKLSNLGLEEGWAEKVRANYDFFV